MTNNTTTNNTTPSARPRGILSARRFARLATTIASLGAATFMAGQNFDGRGFTAAYAQNLSAEAQRAPGPTGFADIVEKVKPAVISVRVKMNAAPQVSMDDQDFQFPPGSPFERFFRRFGGPDGMPQGPRGQAPRNPRQSSGQGSGFFISADGYAVTNNHVVDKADTVEIGTDDGKTYTAKVIGTDSRTDLAVIKVDGANFPYVSLADTAPRIGDWVIAVGNPFGLGGTVTAGIVSARGRDIGAGPYDDFIQIDAPVNKGNSGGPTFNTEGKVIGVNTAIFSPSGGNVGIAFAIPSETAKSVINQLKDKGGVTRGWIGVHIQGITPEIAETMNLKRTEGALVAEPQANGPAAKAGIQSGDVITAVDGNPIRDSRELAKRVGAMAPGVTVKLSVLRNGEEKIVSLTLGELPTTREARATPAEQSEPANSEIPRLGLSLSPGGKNPGDGVMVTEVNPSSVAAERGFRTGDVILDVGGQSVTTPGDVRKALTDARTEGKRSVLMRVKSGDAMKFVAVPLNRG
jgi:serine protease Do